MKVTDQMIAKELRNIGRIYRMLFRIMPRGEKLLLKVKNREVRQKVDRSKMTYSDYIKRPDGSYLRLLIRKPMSRKKEVPGVLWIHGGGYETGMPEMSYFSMANIVAKDCVVIVPSYRLSVEEPYPAALEDCYQSLLWMKRHAKELGIREDQLFVGGESAGGGLTAALCLYARDHGDVHIAFQMPLYPMLDDRMETESMKENNAPVWSEHQNIAAWKRYLEGMDPNNISQYAAPARETEYHGLPPALTFVGTVEPFYDETMEYVKHLKEAGVPVNVKEFRGCFHAFDMMAPWTRQAKEARRYFKREFQLACKIHSKKQS